MASKFFYFGYGSNMLAQRIHIQNPAAHRIGVGKLENYRLDFHTSSKNWLGAPATIVPSSGDIVYGAIWEIECCHLKDLDNQEGVHENIYNPLTLPVFCITTETYVMCRSYQLTNQPTTHLKSMDFHEVPHDRQPSKTYLKTLVKGAIETGVPQYYIDWLKSVRHNCKMVDTLEKYLELRSVEL